MKVEKKLPFGQFSLLYMFVSSLLVGYSTPENIDCNY